MARRFLCGFFRPLFSPGCSSPLLPPRTVAAAATTAAAAAAFFWLGRAARLRQIAFDLRNINLRNLLPVAGAGVATWRPPIDARTRFSAASETSGRVVATTDSLSDRLPGPTRFHRHFELLVVYHANNRQAITLPGNSQPARQRPCHGALVK